MSRDSILIVGSPRDATVRHTVSAFEDRGLSFEVLDLDRFCQRGTIEGSPGDRESLMVRDGEASLRLSEFKSCYARFVELSLNRSGEGEPAWSRYRMLQLAISALDNLVVNRPYAGESNASKPYQTSLIQQHGFRVPRGCSTNLASAAADFVRSCPDGAIYKSNSGERSIVQAVESDDWDRFSLLAQCPVFFQERIWGSDVRIHVVGERCHAVKIRSSAVDYRYDRSGNASEGAVDVPSELAAKCVAVTRACGLEFSGIDFIQSDDDGEFYCLEVNPMPGYHGYDLTLNGAISHSLGDLLSAG